MTESFASGGMLAPDGLCKTFDAAADGYVRGEGCGMVVLKRLADAEADGDRIWGVIRGTAVNQDGASAGLTVPNGPAQERVIEEALVRAGVEPAEVDYLEAHGTGTSLGDPIEVGAAAAIYGRGRAAGRPLLIGSVKTNIGHLEAAAGVAGLVKVLLAMNRGMIPRHLHFERPSPRMEWERLPIQVTAEATQWPETAGRPVRAGLSSFGFSGTNAHVVVEAYGERPGGFDGPEGTSLPVVDPDGLAGETRPAGTGQMGRAWLLPLSGKSDGAVRELAGRYLDWMTGRGAVLEAGAGAAESDGTRPTAGTLLADMAWTAGSGRSHFGRRAGVVFGDAAELGRKLEALADGGAVATARKRPKVGFVFTGQGSQSAGMGRELYETQPVARAVLERCEEAMREIRGVSLLAVMFGEPEAAGDLDDTAWTQPALYALESALAELWASVGVRPAAVLGHSVGEIAAARAAGAFGLEDGLRFAAARGELMGSLPTEGPGAGAMAAVFASAERVATALEEARVKGEGADLGVAADNGTHQVVSGPTEQVEWLATELGTAGVRVERLNTSHAFHSALMEPVLEGLEELLEGISVKPPEVALVSNLTGQAMESGEVMDGAYWRRQAREPVAFAEGVRTLAGLGVEAVVEIGPGLILGPLAASAWPADGAERLPLVVIGSQRRGGSGAAAFAEAVAQAYEAGTPIAFAGLYAGERRRRVSVPTYPFQRQRYWIDERKRRSGAVGHPLLGVRRDSAGGETTFETELFATDPAWLADHRVFGQVVVPGALQGSLAATAGSIVNDGSVAVAVSDFHLHAPLVLPDAGEEGDAQGIGRSVQVVLSRLQDSAARSVQIFTRGGQGEPWTLNAEGRVSTDAAAASAQIDLEALKAGLSAAEVGTLFRNLAATGIEFGPAFHGLDAVWVGSDEALGEITLPTEAADSGLAVHPGQLAGCFQVVAAAAKFAEGERPTAFVPSRWDRLWLLGPLPDPVVCHARIRNDGGSETSIDKVARAELRLYDATGTEIGGASGFTLRPVTRAALAASTEDVSDLLYQVVWRESPYAGALPPADFLENPSAIHERSRSFSEHLAEEGLNMAQFHALQEDLDRLGRSYSVAALERLGWRCEPGAEVSPADLRQRLKVVADHDQLLRRLFEALTEPGVLAGTPGSAARWVVADDAENLLRDGSLRDPDALHAELRERHPYGAGELDLLARCGSALADVLRGRANPMSPLYTGEESQALSPCSGISTLLAVSGMVAEVVSAVAASLPAGRQLRVLELAGGNWSTTGAVLEALPAGRFNYVCTHAFEEVLSEREHRLRASYPSIEYRLLDIEANPIEQGFDAHGYDLVIATEILQSAQDLGKTLQHFRDLLAPSGELVALERPHLPGWLDLTLGLPDGPRPAAGSHRWGGELTGDAELRAALADAGFGEAAVWSASGETAGGDLSDWNLTVARGPEEVVEQPGMWVLSGSGGAELEQLAASLAARNQSVLVAGEAGDAAGPQAHGNVAAAYVDPARREAWRSLLNDLRGDVPLRGVVHLAGLEGHGTPASAEEMALDARSTVSSALALVQGLVDVGAEPEGGLWFLTRGAQVVDRERDGQLAGATLWGLGRAVALEAPQLRPRMIDLDAGGTDRSAALVDELLHPDRETQLAYRAGGRFAARLVPEIGGDERLRLPDERGWRLARNAGEPPEDLGIVSASTESPGEGEIRISVEAAGLSLQDPLFSSGDSDADLELATEACGRVLEIGSGVEGIGAGDLVLGFIPGTLGPEAVTRAELMVKAPAGVSAVDLATVPTAFVTATLGFESAQIAVGDRILVHDDGDGVGRAAVQLARQAGIEVIAATSTADPEQLRSLGVKLVVDSRPSAFADEVLKATRGEGVTAVLNSSAEPGSIEASLPCLASGGRFVDLAKKDIWTKEQMAAERPDVDFHVVGIDTLASQQPAKVGDVLRSVVARLAAGDLTPLDRTVWPVAEAGRAVESMRSGSPAGKVVLVLSALAADRLREDGTYLVTGGLGGIGRLVAGWLADRGARSIVLNARRSPDDRAEAAIEALRQRGVKVRVELADVADAGSVDAMLQRIEAAMPPLAGVVHCAGVLSGASLANQDWERFDGVLRPKLMGAWNLHRATAGRDLHLFVLFSSMAGVLGLVGHANYAAANAFLDQLARHRRALGLPGQSVAWGAWDLWSGLGGIEDQRERVARRMESAGVGWIVPRQGLQVLDRIVRQDVPTGAVASMDWSLFVSRLTAVPALLEDLALTAGWADRHPASRRVAGSGDLLARLRNAPLADREDLLVALLQGELQAVLRMASTPDPSVGFFELGMDSLMAVELRNRLRRVFASDFAVSDTVVFDHPDVASLASHLAAELAGAGPRTVEPERPIRMAPEDGRIAIVGMACRFPGGAGLSEFWQLLEAGKETVTAGRRDWGSGSGSIHPSQDIGGNWASFVDGIDRFDAEFFRIAPVEARLLDPQQRLLLETTWEALEEAGVDPGALKGTGTGVYVGISSAEYRDLVSAADPDNASFHMATGTVASTAIGRVAFTLGLEGPAMAVDTACSSSLVAVHQAVASLQRGEADLALAGGVNAILKPALHASLVEAGMMAPDGRCKTFDAEADGYGRGEGCGMVVLKRLADAEADGDRIWGVVRGTAVNQDGASAGLTVPNGPAQEQVIAEALARAGVEPAEVDYLEAHGTGTELGDPIEVNAAAAVYGRGRELGRPLLIGSVKTNIGHLEAAAGVAGLVKVLLAMNRGVIPRHLHFERPSPRMDWERLPVRVTAEATEWPETEPAGRYGLA